MNFKSKKVIFPSPKSVGKRDWGFENLLVLIPKKLSLKHLFIKKTKKGGLQYHRKKNECGYILSGKLLVRYDDGKGKLRKNFSLFETFLSGFPAGTVSGAPKIRAMEIIDELENSKRKLYAGGIGYFTANQDFDTCIALRTALIKNKKIYVQAGAGIVADSNPNNEYNETVNKAKALLKAIN